MGKVAYFGGLFERQSGPEVKAKVMHKKSHLEGGFFMTDCPVLKQLDTRPGYS